jgi:hypothetical protein
MDYLVLRHGEQSVFIGDPSLQVSVHTLGGSLVEPITCYEDARHQLVSVMVQGEGGFGLYDKSPFQQESDALQLPHFYRFNEIAKGRRYRPLDDIMNWQHPTGEALDTDWEAVYKFAPNPRAADYLDVDETIYNQMMDFNACYTKFMIQLHQAFNGQAATFTRTVGAMYTLKSLALTLLKTPAPGSTGMSVGVPWEFLDATQYEEHPCPMPDYTV